MSEVSYVTYSKYLLLDRRAQGDNALDQTEGKSYADRGVSQTAA
jgi:hypothetical protein